MKAVFEGSISFGLVSIPIKLYSAVEPKMISFKLLCEKCKTPLKYKRFCPKCKKEVEWSEVVKGLKVAKDKYFVLTKEELHNIMPEKTKLIEIKQFVNAMEVDPIYYDKYYYAVPQNEMDKAYFLFHEILSLTGKAAVATFVMHEKERICLISAYKRGLLLTTLNYAYEIRDIDAIVPEAKPKLSSQEKMLAKKIIEQLESEFDINAWKDTFAEELKKLIKAKLEGKEIVMKEKEKPKAKTLLEALKASVK
jgi:DNA end-binding protein Ku